eukprot:Clim_evm13s164 gene=Clim_evmTU13s164
MIGRIARPLIQASRPVLRSRVAGLVHRTTGSLHQIRYQSINQKQNEGSGVSIPVLGTVAIIGGIVLIAGSQDISGLISRVAKDAEDYAQAAAPSTGVNEALADQVRSDLQRYRREQLERQRKIVDGFKNSELPEKVAYLIVGGGTAGFAAVKAILENDKNAKILVVTDEKDPAYMRPPLSKELWFSEDDDVVTNLKFKDWSGKDRTLTYEGYDWYNKAEELDPEKDGHVVALMPDTKVERLNVLARKAFFEGGRTVSYEKCLLATGGTPRNLKVLENASEKVKARSTLYRKIDDYRKLYIAIKSKQINSIAVVGGGFLGSELTFAIVQLKQYNPNLKVHQVYPEEGNMGQVFPRYLSKWTKQKVEAQGVQVHASKFVDEVSFANHKLKMTFQDDESIIVDHIVAAVGIDANTDVGKASGLEVDPSSGGLLVNSEFESRRDVWVAGDLASFFDADLGRRRVEHHDHAVVSGRLAGENMVGKRKPYMHQSMFWSDLGPEIGYEAIGICDASLPTVSIWAYADEEDKPKYAGDRTGDEKLIDSSEEKPETPQKTTGDIPMRTKVEEQTEQTKEGETETKTIVPSVLQKEKEYGKGVVFYLRDDVVVGVILWNIFDKIPLARRILKEQRKVEDVNELAKHFKVHS